MPDKKSPLTVKCPTCGKTVSWTEDFPAKPFCCERCKLIDLGAWATEDNVIPGEPISDNSQTEDPSSYH